MAKAARSPDRKEQPATNIREMELDDLPAVFKLGERLFTAEKQPNLYRTWDVDVIGMTNIPEAKLAREAELCYSTVALATDYDCWHDTEDDVSVEAILEIMHKNVENAKKAIAWAARNMDEKDACHCGEALKFAIVTDPARIPDKVKKDLEPIIKKYIK